MDRETKILYMIAAVGFLIVTMDAAHRNPITMGLWTGGMIAFSIPFWQKPLHRPVGWWLPVVVLVAMVVATVCDYAFRALRHAMGV